MRRLTALTALAIGALVVLWLGSAPAHAQTCGGARFDQALAAFQAKDYAKALPSMTALGECGHPRAQFLLGEIYNNGLGVSSSTGTALNWYMESAAQGYEEAFQMLDQGVRVKMNGVTK